MRQIVHKPIHILSRAVIISNDHLLLARFVKENGTATCFLPGGHVEYNESIETALKRELNEELGLTNVGAVQLLGIYEYSFDHDGSPQHEINFLLSCNSPNFAYPQAPVSVEPKLSFFWQDLSQLDQVNFLPVDFCTLIPKLLKQKAISGNQWRVNLASF